MGLSILLFILILCIAFFQATQGFFSALIMTVLTICCAALAVCTYEWVALNWLAKLWRADYAPPIALGALFGLPLLLLRTAMDSLIRRSCLLPSWVDRIGGGACGLVTGMLMGGVIAMCVQMIPFGGSFLGYARIELPNKEIPEGGGDPKPPNPDKAEEELFLTPDRFAVGLAGLLSDGLFSGPRSFRAENPDAVQAIGWRNAVPSEVPRYAPPNSIAIVRVEPLSYLYRRTPGAGREEPGKYEPLAAKEGHELQMIRVQLKREAWGSAKGHLFSLRQFRLVGKEEEQRGLRQYHPVAIQQEDKNESVNRHVKLARFRRSDWPVVDDVLAPREGNEGQVEIVFELPKGFKPDYLEYKFGVRVPVSFEDQPTLEAAPPPPPLSDEPTDAPTRTRGRRGGNVSSFTVASSSFGDKLPFTLQAYTQLKNAEISRGKLINGHLVAQAEEQEAGKNPPVEKLDVPDDKRLLHLSAEYLQTRSTLGGALGFAVKTVQNYIVTDSNGNQYQLVGKYAAADVEGRRVVEVQYFRDQTGSIGGVGKFDKIQDRHLKDNYKLVFLFLVEPGAKIVSFSTGAGESRKEDLTDANIVAPN